MLLIQLQADKTTRLLVMAAAGADSFRQKGSELARIDLLDTASDRKFIAVVYRVIHNAGLDCIDLQKEITDQTENVRITGLRLDDCKLIVVIVAVADQRDSGDLQFLQRQVGIAEQGNQALINLKRLSHIHIQRIKQFRKLVGVRVQSVIQRRSENFIAVHIKVFFLEQLPHQCSAASQIRCDNARRNRILLLLMVVDDNNVIRRDPGHISGAVLTVNRYEQTVHMKGLSPLQPHIFNRQMQLLHHEPQV